MTQPRHHRLTTAGRLVAVLAAGLLTTQCGGVGDTEPAGGESSAPEAEDVTETPEDPT